MAALTATTALVSIKSASFVQMNTVYVGCAGVSRRECSHPCLLYTSYDGVPSDANIIDSIDLLTGRWKALIVYDPNNEYDAGAMEFLNIALAGTAESLSLTLDWYQIFWANEG